MGSLSIQLACSSSMETFGFLPLKKPPVPGLIKSGLPLEVYRTKYTPGTSGMTLVPLRNDATVLKPRNPNLFKTFCFFIIKICLSNYYSPSSEAAQTASKALSLLCFVPQPHNLSSCLQRYSHFHLHIKKKKTICNSYKERRPAVVHFSLIIILAIPSTHPVSRSCPQSARPVN